MASPERTSISSNTRSTCTHAATNRARSFAGSLDNSLLALERLTIVNGSIRKSGDQLYRPDSALSRTGGKCALANTRRHGLYDCARMLPRKADSDKEFEGVPQ